MVPVVKQVKRTVRAALVRGVPRGIRRWLVARYPSLPLTPHNVGEAAAKFDGSAWERFYSDEDPYGIARSEYERLKYERTLDAVGPGPYGRALEVGCSVGVFTAMLAPRCVELWAVDIAENAVKQARTRVRSFPHVRCERRTIPEDMPLGSFDLIVCSDVLYYWPVPALRAGARVLEAALAPRGRLVAAHYTGRADAGTRLDGNIVHDELARVLTIDHTASQAFENYRIDRYERRAVPIAAGAS